MDLGHLFRSLAMCCAVTAAVICLGRCAAVPESGPKPHPQARQAEQAEAVGDWAEAARLWQSAADAGAGDRAITYRLNAAEAWLNAGQPEGASVALGALEPAQLDAADSARHALIQADVALQAGDPERAELWLMVAREAPTAGTARRIAGLEQQLEELRADPASRAVDRAASLIAGLEGYDSVLGQRLLQVFEDVPSGRLATLAQQGSPLGEWAALALSLRTALVSGGDLMAAARRWAEEHPDHPVSVEEYLELGWQYGQLFSPPGRIAVLLPFNGGLAGAARAIRDGLVTALQDQPASSELTFVAVDDTSESAVRGYRRAVMDGYHWVIGPLRRESVQAVRGIEGHRVPALLLNRPREVDVPPGGAETMLFDLSLSQEEEARAVAGTLLDRGLSRVIMLVADEAWGDRMQAAFSEAFVAGGGEIVAGARFLAGGENHAEQLAALLRIEDSRQRKDRLQAALSVPLQFEPTRRDDFEAIFMAADPDLGRQLTPQLRYYDAGEKPVYAMSRVFSGRLNPAADQDLNGVVFGGTHWALGAWEGPQIASLGSLRGGALGSLFALGSDAWNVLPWLGLMGKDPDLAFPGATGRLRLQRGGRLSREPVWVRFEGGRPRAHASPSPE